VITEAKILNIKVHNIEILFNFTKVNRSKYWLAISSYVGICLSTIKEEEFIVVLTAEFSEALDLHESSLTSFPSV
jgi:hypothetical protein